MHLCFSTLVCPDWTLAQVIGAAAAHAIGGIDFRGLPGEIDITRHPLFNAELDYTLDLLRQHKLAMPCLNTSIVLVAPAADRWQMMLEECSRYAALAARTQTPFLRIFGGAVPKGMTDPEALLLAQRHLRQLVKLCAGSGCQVLLETHDAWSASPQVLQLISGFSPDEVGVLWDFEHPYRKGESPRETAAALKNYIRHVHIKDSVRQDQRSIPTLLGQGDLPLPDLLDALRAIDYDAWICLETEKRWHPREAPDPETSIPQFVHFMQEHLRSET